MIQITSIFFIPRFGYDFFFFKKIDMTDLFIILGLD